MEKTCRQCSAGFEVTNDDLAFYEKVSPEFNGKKELITTPTLCPSCRYQRRLSYRNERHLFHRKCDKTGKQIISQYSDPSLKVFTNEVWWGDSWNPTDYGRDVDLSRSFFEQFAELQKAVPHISLINDSSNENSDYANQTAFLKNCYLVFSSDRGQDSYYLHGGNEFRSCMDCYHGLGCELCYECFECVRCYRLFFSQGCENCSDSYFLRDCKGCRDCFGCSALRNRQYCMFNEQLDKKTYMQRLSEYHLSSHSELERIKKEMQEWMLTKPVRSSRNINAENSTGDFLTNVHNLKMCFDCINIHDCSYCTQLSDKVTDCMDYDVAGIGAELIFESITIGYGAMRILFSTDCWMNVHNLTYCDGCVSSHDLFGCASMKNASYCILNKQYTKDEYERLVSQIINNMRENGEWGEFMPMKNSLFGYNESAVCEYFPLEKKEVLHNHWKWSQEAEKGQQYLGPEYVPPDDIADVPDSITTCILRCEATGKFYKIIPQELDFYRQLNLPIPRKCPDQRHRERFGMKNPRKLWTRECANCHKTVQTTYAPDRPEVVFCEECYFASVYV